MEKHTIKVPKEIRYISDWDNLEEGKRLRDLVPSDQSYIMNKTITGCGYTEYWLNNDQNIILCSPRLVLLENKEEQHKDQENLLYLKNEFDSFEEYDKDISKNQKVKDVDKGILIEEERKLKAEEYTKYLSSKISDHILNCTLRLKKPTKFMVTYDSFRRIKEVLGENIRFYRIIVDEFQSIFCDSRFKSDTENEFMYNLRGLNNIVYLSATPMIDTYLEQLDEYKDLPYYELDWANENPGRVVKPYLKTKLISKDKSITSEVERIVNTYREGRFEKLTRQKEDGSFEEVYSKEAVFYINSVKNLCDIIRKCKLKPEETNVLCSGNDENNKKVRDAFRSVDKTSVGTKDKCIGRVPKEGEHHKMFTLCTRTVYLGADFYSTNARSFIFSDANVDCLSVDITLDLPQILGRQRLVENPWKNRAELFYKLNTREITEEEFNEYLEKKKRVTEDLLKLYGRAEGSEKHSAAEMYQFVAKTKKYRDDFVAVNKHAGSDLQPAFNKLVMISEMRAFDVQKIDYKDRFNVFSSLSKVVGGLDDVNFHLDKLYSFKYLPDKLRYLCSLDESMANSLLPHLPESFNNYYTVLGPDKMRALRFDATDLRKAYDGVIGNQEIDIKSAIIKEFEIDQTYSKADVKKKLGNLYKNLGYSKTPRAVDLGDYFIIKNCQMTNKETGKRDHMYKIISIKEE